MEQWTNDDISTEQIEDSSNSPPQKRAKRQPGDNLQQVETTSFNADPSENDLTGAEHLVNQPSQVQIMWWYIQLYSDSTQLYTFGGRLCCGPWGESWTKLRWFEKLANWHKSLQESHSAQIKKKSLLGHLVCSGEAQRKILESDIFRILESEGVTDRCSVQSLFWSLDQKRRRRNFKVERSNAVLAIQKSALIFGNELILS